MFSTEVNALLSGNNLEVLKLLAKYEPEQFKSNLSQYSQEGNSFFVSFFKKNDQIEYVKGMLELCESFGYSFADGQRNYMDEDNNRFYKSGYYSSNGSNVPKNNKNPQQTPEYVLALAYARTDETFAFLTEKVGKQKVLQMEKEGWPIIEYAYKKNFSKTIELLYDYGLDYENTPSGVSILSIIDKNQPMVDLYWKMKDKREQKEDEKMSEGQFLHFFKTIDDNIKRISSKQDYTTQNTIELIQQKKDILSKEQKEKLLIKSLECIDLVIYKSLVKMLGYRQNSNEVKDLVLPHLGEIKNHNMLYFVVEEKEYLFKKVDKFLIKKNDNKTNELSDSVNNLYGIDILATKLEKLGINPNEKHQHNRNKSFVNRAFLDRFTKIFDEEKIFFEKFDNGLTLFEKIATLKTNIKSNDLLSFLNIKPRASNEKDKSLLDTLDESTFREIKDGNKEFSEEQKTQIRDFLEKTWFSKDESGLTLISKMSFSSVSSHDFWIFNEKLLKEKDLFKNEEKLKMLELLVEDKAKNSWQNKIFKDVSSWSQPERNDYADIKLLKNLYLILKDDNKTNWLDFKLSNNSLMELENSEFLFELKARQLSHKLNNELNKSNENNVKVKFKI